ncbi:hypothetical protein [uncultured Roseovarius sp.]|uniref:hypothetical protein n=1 Tax=uncultured Roseovarius sp. TaxID=293344 RepID=UPI000C99187D|nr:hypothetical protein [Roseovarius sp.]HCQ58777.1 hypothetical protein [Sulfitobacter sp.]|tara:strand:- start:226 stop:1323 length:1098 start_codon:yes stop_codon:yes gene_type:complete
MIFLLDETSEQLEAQDGAQVEDLFSRLIETDRRGRHYFVLSRVLADWALENLALSARHKSHLVGIREQYAMRGALPKSSGVFLQIGFESIGVCQMNEGFFKIGVDAFLAGEYAESRAALVLEDIVNDAGLYKHVLGEARKLTNVPNFNFEPVHSGGSRIVPVFETEVNKGKVVCCIVDTDMLAPCSKKGVTARNVLAIQRRRNEDTASTAASFVGRAFCTVGHELENCIPYFIVKEFAAVSQLTSDILDRVAVQDDSVDAGTCFWLHFDVKNGLCGETIIEKREAGHLSEASVTWIQARLGLNDQDFRSVKIDGFGEEIVDKFLSSPAALRKFHTFTRTNYWKSLFLERFEELLWYFAAPARERV